MLAISVPSKPHGDIIGHAAGIRLQATAAAYAAPTPLITYSSNSLQNNNKLMNDTPLVMTMFLSDAYTKRPLLTRVLI